ncbi:lipopolysaccharide biosynthesis protein [Marinobacter adhaerens]|uniref:lipopolysaccharide biosynthesis protein n=1 Tax=Marinobacter adhaerens TaxID=1033846 RepID=UPI001C567827|nr:lipopolysaccharide biosynthesis protein [Marinobacter adhaerens]MBW3226017.1 lipopolysaccharide biosynthesis protein [Marinobacter adhaerens]
MPDNLKKKFVSGIAWNIVDKLISQFGFLIVTLYLAKLIGPESFGLIGMLTIFMLLAESVVSSGFSQALVQRSADLTADDASTIFYVNLVYGLTIYGLLYFAAPLIAEFYGEAALTDISRLLFLIIIINSLAVVVRAQLTIRIDFRSQAIAGAFATVISSSIGLYLAISGYDYWSLVWMLILRSLVQTVSLWFFTRWLPSLVFNFDSFKSLFGFGSNLMLAGLVSTLVNNLYIALVGKYFNAASVGYFTQATNLTNFLSKFISSTMQGVSYPILTSIKQDSERLTAVFRKTLQLTMFISLPALVGFAAVARDFVELFLGSQWLPAVPIIQILCFARAITPISIVNMNILNAIGRSDLYLKVDLVKLPLTVGTLLVSVNFGVESVAIAVLINVLMSFLINSYFPGKLFGFGALNQLKAAKSYLLAAGVMFIVVKFVGFSGDWYWLPINIGVGAVVYFGVLLLFRDDVFLSLAYKLGKRFRF